MPVSANLPSTSRPGVMTVALIGSSMLKPGASLPKPCQSSFGPQHPVLAIADALFGELVRAPDLEPPVLAVFVVDLAHRAAEVERLDDRFLDQRRAARRLHHRRGDVARGDDRVLRRGRCVHQVRLVEAVPVELARLASPAPGSARPATCPPAACASTGSRRPASPWCAAGPCRSRACRGRTRGTPRAAATPRRSAACRSCRRSRSLIVSTL